MPTLWDKATRDELIGRLGRLRPDTPAAWGKLTCPGMLAHVNDGFRMALGEIRPKSKRVFVRFFPFKQLFVYVLPMPKGLPTAPELLTRSTGADWEREVHTFPELVDKFTSRRDLSNWPPHPAFGGMSKRDWGALMYRHTTHHFTQFGV